jgi:hypothetical protein
MPTKPKSKRKSADKVPVVNKRRTIAADYKVWLAGHHDAPLRVKVRVFDRIADKVLDE